jgi:archaellum component FlaC
MLHRYLKEFCLLTEARVEEVEDELGAVVAEVGNGVEVSGGPHPTLWKGVSSNFETSLAMGSDFKRVLDDVSEMELTTEQIEGKVEQVLREIRGLKREVLQISTLRSGFQDQRTKVTEIDANIVALSTLLQSVNIALLGSAATGT